MKLTKKQEASAKRLRCIGKLAQILRARRNCTNQHALKVAKRFVAIYGVGQ